VIVGQSVAIQIIKRVMSSNTGLLFLSLSFDGYCRSLDVLVDSRNEKQNKNTTCSRADGLSI
jgi:hypothetical protein